MNNKTNNYISVITTILYVLLIIGLIGGLYFIISNALSEDEPSGNVDTETYSITYTYEVIDDTEYTFTYNEDNPAASYAGFSVDFGYTISDGGRLSAVSVIRVDTNAELASLTTSETFTTETKNSETVWIYTYTSTFIMPESDVAVTVYIKDKSSGSSGGGSDNDDEDEVCAHEYIGSDYIIAEKPTYTDAGSAYWVCTLCGNEYPCVLIALQYIGDNFWTLYDTNATCTVDGEAVYTITLTLSPYEDERTLTADIKIVNTTPALGHLMSDPEVSVIPTFSTEGEVVSTCSRCGYSVSYSLPVLSDSNYSVFYDTATCTENGTAYYYIVVNDYEIIFEAETLALGHSYSEYTVSVLPTYTTSGDAYRTCARCEDVDTVTLPVLTDSSYIITNSTATAYETGTATFAIEINGETISFIAETPRRSVDGVNPIFINSYLYSSSDGLIDYSTFLESSNNVTVIGDGESAILYFYAYDRYYFGGVSAENCDVDYTISDEYKTLCVTISNVTGEVTLSLVICVLHTITLSGASDLDVTMSIGDLSYEIYNTASAAVTTSAKDGLTFVFTGNDTADEHPCTITVTYVFYNGLDNVSKTVNSYFFFTDDSDYNNYGVGVYQYYIADESYYVTSGNVSELVHCYVGYLTLYFGAADFDIIISVSTETAEELYTMYENGEISIYFA